MSRSLQEAGIRIPTSLKRAAQPLILAGTIGGATLFSGCGPIEANALFAPKDDPQGHFLVINQDNREPLFVTQPFPARVIFVPPQRPFEGDTTRGKILVRRIPQESSSFEGTEYLSPAEINAQYGIRVAGGMYVGAWGSKELSYKGEIVSIGVWFGLSDKEGNFVTPSGVRLKEKEKPYFVAANSVTVIPEEKETRLTYEDIIQTNAKFYYDGAVTLSKAVNARRAPKISSEHPTESNVIPWARIISINGVNIERVTTMTVQKPLATDEGENPTQNLSFSRWLVFLAEVKDAEGKVIKIPLYINGSRQTRELVVPERPWTAGDFTPIDFTPTKTPKDLGTVQK